MPGYVAQRFGQPGRGFLRCSHEPLGGGAAAVERSGHDDGGVDAAVVPEHRGCKTGDV